MGLVRVRLWEELQKYTEPRYDAKYEDSVKKLTTTSEIVKLGIQTKVRHKSDGEEVKGYDLGRRDFARELWKLIKEKTSE